MYDLDTYLATREGGTPLIVSNRNSQEFLFEDDQHRDHFSAHDLASVIVSVGTAVAMLIGGGLMLFSDRIGAFIYG